MSWIALGMIRIPVSALEEFMMQGTVDPIVITGRSGRVA